MTSNINKTLAKVNAILDTWHNAKEYGAVGDGVTDDSAALQAALDAVGTRGRLVIPPGDYVVTTGLEIALSSDADDYLEIIGYGANLEISGAIVGLGRERPADDETTWTNSRITVRGLKITGDNTTGQIGFAFYNTYGLHIEDCHAIATGIGFLSVFGLSARFENCYTTNCAVQGFWAASGVSQIDYGSGEEDALGSTGANSSASNGTVISKCRVFASAGSVSHFRADASQVQFHDCIAEGGSADYCFYYEAYSVSVNRGIVITWPHIECEPNIAAYRIATTTGNCQGTFSIYGQTTTLTGAGADLVDVGTVGQTSYIRFIGCRLVSNVVDLVRGTVTSYYPRFYIDRMNPADWLDSAKWSGGTVGNVTTAPGTYSGNDGYLVSNQKTLMVTGYTDWTISSHLIVNPVGDVTYNMDAGQAFVIDCANEATGGLTLKGRFRMSQAETGYTTLGSVVGRAAIYDDTDTLIGYAPLYDSITA